MSSAPIFVYVRRSKKWGGQQPPIWSWQSTQSVYQTWGWHRERSKSSAPEHCGTWKLPVGPLPTWNSCSARKIAEDDNCNAMHWSAQSFSDFCEDHVEHISWFWKLVGSHRVGCCRRNKSFERGAGICSVSFIGWFKAISWMIDKDEHLGTKLWIMLCLKSLPCFFGLETEQT